MVSPQPTKDDTKLYPEILYFAKRVSTTGHQPVMKKVLPDGEPTELDPKPRQDLNGHDFDGFQWGYGGSGPARLSLALLLDATSDPEMAMAYYQDFKWGQVSIWGDVWSIKRSEVLRWLEVQRKKQLESMLNRN